MFGLRRHAGETQYAVLIDIGSGTIGVAIVESTKSEALPHIIYEKRSTMRVGKHTGYTDENIRRIREMLFTATLLLSQEGLERLRTHNPHGKITDISVTCSAPWALTVSRSVTYSDDKPFKVTEEMLRDLMLSAETEIIAHVRELTETEKDEFNVVERITVDVSVNEYPVKNPLGLTGTTLGLTHIAGVFPQKVVDSVVELQEKIFSDASIHAHSSMLVAYSVMRNLFPRTSTYAIINVSAEATEFGIVENDILIENTSIGSGTNGYVQDLMKKTERPLADIESALTAFGDPAVHDDEMLLSVAPTYTEAIALGVQNIMERRTFPTKIIITAHEPYKKLFTKLVSDGVRAGADKKPDSLALDQNLIRAISGDAGDDVYLALSARFFHKMHLSGLRD